MFKRSYVGSVLLTSATIFVVSDIYAQNYPNKPIRIVTSAAGSGSDLTARITAQGLSNALNQPTIVDNRAGTVIPGEVVAKAPADGYALLVAGGQFWTAPLLTKAPYDPIRDFSPITSIEMAV